MPVRIYSLAKELKLDSKILVDICTSAGVTGKGSALASLTDEEVERVKAYLSGAGPGGKATASVIETDGGFLRTLKLKREDSNFVTPSRFMMRSM